MNRAQLRSVREQEGLILALRKQSSKIRIFETESRIGSHVHLPRTKTVYSSNHRIAKSSVIKLLLKKTNETRDIISFILLSYNLRKIILKINNYYVI